MRTIQTWQNDTWMHRTSVTERHLNAPHKHDRTTPEHTATTWQKDSLTHCPNMTERLLNTLYKHEGMTTARIVLKMTEQFLNAPYKHDATTPKCTVQTLQNDTWMHHRRAGLHSTFLSFSALICLDISHVCQYLALFANMLVCIPTSRHVC